MANIRICDLCGAKLKLPALVLRVSVLNENTNPEMPGTNINHDHDHYMDVCGGCAEKMPSALAVVMVAARTKVASR